MTIYISAFLIVGVLFTGLLKQCALKTPPPPTAQEKAFAELHARAVAVREWDANHPDQVKCRADFLREASVLKALVGQGVAVGPFGEQLAKTVGAFSLLQPGCIGSKSSKYFASALDVWDATYRFWSYAVRQEHVFAGGTALKLANDVMAITDQSPITDLPSPFLYNDSYLHDPILTKINLNRVVRVGLSGGSGYYEGAKLLMDTEESGYEAVLKASAK